MNNTYTMSMAIPQIAVEHKFMLTIEEAGGLFGIGQHTLRRLINENPRANYLLHIGTKTLIKRDLFLEFILQQSTI